MFEFEYPYVWGLLFLFILGALYLKPKEDALLLPGPLKIPSKIVRFSPFFKWVGLVFFIFALSSPITKDNFIPNKKPAHAIMLVLDASGSMKERVRRGNEIVNKFMIAQEIGADFIKKRESDHVGIVAFGSFAYVASPLTFDTKATSDIMSRMKLGVAGDKTALRDGIFMATRMLKRSNAKEKVVIVLTDGYDTASQIPPKTLVRALDKERVKVYAIGVGDPRAYDVKFLQFLAKESGGEFYGALSEEDLKEVYEQINKLEKTDLEDEQIEQKYYWFQYPLFVSLLSFLLFLFLRVKRSGA